MKERIAKKGKRYLLQILVLVLMIGMFPLSQYQVQAHTYDGKIKVEVKTSDTSKAGTDNSVTFKMQNSEDIKLGAISKGFGGHGNDFQRNDQDTYEYSYKNILDPWKYDRAGFKLGNELLANPGWKCGWATIEIESPINSSMVNIGDKIIQETWFEKNQEILVNIDSKRRISDVSVFSDVFQGDHYVGTGASETVNIQSKKDMTISDQYGRYNPYDYSESPKLKVDTRNNGTDYSSFFTLSEENGLKYELKNKNAFLQSMREKSVFDLAFKASWDFPTHGANKNENTNKTFNIHRLEYQEPFIDGVLKQPEKPENSIVGSDGNHFYNKEANTLKWNIEYQMPQDIYNTWESNNNINPKIKVYRGKGTSDYLGSAVVTKKRGSSGIGYLECSFEVPDDYTSEGDGITMEVSNTDIKIANKGTFRLGAGVGSVGTPYIYFSEYKVDTKHPETELVTKEGAPLVLNKNKKEQSFYIRSTEALEGGTATFTLMNDANKRVPFKPLAGNLESSVISDVRAVTPEVLNTSYKSALAEDMEGYFDLHIAYNDIAKNDGKQIVKKISLDNQAPRVELQVLPKQSDVTGSKRTDYKFSIDDFQEPARVYYCFVPKGDELDESGSKDAQETSGANIKENKWYFVNQNGESSTAVLKVDRGEDFEGTLFYYSDDGVGNKSNMNKREANIYNDEAWGSLIVADDTPALPAYDIHFSELKDSTASYQWIERNAESSGFQMDMKEYANENIGRKQQKGRDGKNYTLNGSYTLKYQIKNDVSGNSKEFEKDFVFDNSNPIIKLPQWKDGQLVRDVQTATIRISDVSDITEASYQVTDLHGDVIKGFEEKVLLPVNDGKVETSITLSNLDNGIYGLKIYAKDKNDFEKTVWYGGSEGSFHDNDQAMWNDILMSFAIRSQAPEMNANILNTQLQIGNRYYTTQDAYALSLEMTDPMLHLPAEGFFENFIKYQVSTDGEKWGEWLSVADAKMQRATDAFKGTITLPNPVPLQKADGVNKLYIRTACFSSGDKVSNRTLPQAISKPFYAEVVKDTSGPIGNVVYKTPGTTNKDVEVDVQLSDKLADTKTLELFVHDADKDKITLEKSENVNGKYMLTVKENVDTTLTAKDQLGNTSEIKIYVNNIDRTPPVSSGTVQTIQSGERLDAEATIAINNMNPFKTKLALAPGNGVTTFTQQDYDRYMEYLSKGLIQQTISDIPLQNNEVNREMKLKIKGFDGDWTLGISCQDTLGNHQESAVASISIKNAIPQLVESKFSPEITKSETVGSFNFNVPVLILPEALVTENEQENLELIGELGSTSDESEMQMTMQQVYAEKKDIVFYISDSIGNAQKVSASMDSVQFIDGFDIKTSYLKNAKTIQVNDGKWIGLQEKDILSIVVEPDEKYKGQYFYEAEEESNWILDEVASIKTEYSDPAASALPEELIGKQLYSKMVYHAKHDGKSLKTLHVSSYTMEGNMQDRKQDELLTVTNVDESLPEAEIVYATNKPTNQNVAIALTARDAQSGIIKIEEKTTESEYHAIYDQTQSSPTVRVESSINTNEDVHMFRITNSAGMIIEREAKVSNIDKTMIELNKHFTISYTYQGTDSKWHTVEEGKAYQKVKATIIPTKGSGKNLSIKNNQGKFDVILNPQNAAFEIFIKDEAGNEITQTLEWGLYDTIAPVIEDPVYDHSLTNKDVEVTIHATDSSAENQSVITEASLQLIGVGNIPLEKVSNGVYKGIMTQNGTYLLKAKDYAGNEATRQFTINNINRTAPIATKVSYSIAQDIVTSNSVVVKAESFDKHVQDFTIAPVSGEDLSFVNYKEGAHEVRFLRNGSVNLLFRDDYGNIGATVLTVSNIKNTPPNIEAVINYTADSLKADISFQAAHVEGIIDDDLKKLFITAPLLNAGKQTALVDLKGDVVKVTVKENGTYTFKISDEAGNAQELHVTITNIDKSAPKVLALEWEYDYLDPNEDWITKKYNGKHDVAVDEQEFIINDQVAPYTNKDVKVTVKTDKDISQIGSKYGTYGKESSMIYTANGFFSFNLEAMNATSTLFGVGVNIIDKEKPVLKFEQKQELIFVQGANDAELMYSKDKLYDYTAYDNNQKDISEQVQIDFGNFDPDDINANEFNRNKPYFIVYSIRDKAGNITEVTRTIRLIGLTDTVALVNGILPTGNIASVEGNEFQVALKNFSGKAYLRYWKGSLSMGEMKSKGTSVQPNSKGNYALKNLDKGWYTVSVQTEKKDFFNINIYVNP